MGVMDLDGTVIINLDINSQEVLVLDMKRS